MQINQREGNNPSHLEQTKKPRKANKNNKINQKSLCSFCAGQQIIVNPKCLAKFNI